MLLDKNFMTLKLALTKRKILICSSHDARITGASFKRIHNLKQSVFKENAILLPPVYKTSRK